MSKLFKLLRSLNSKGLDRLLVGVRTDEGSPRERSLESSGRSSCGLQGCEFAPSGVLVTLACSPPLLASRPWLSDFSRPLRPQEEHRCSS